MFMILGEMGYKEYYEIPNEYINNWEPFGIFLKEYPELMATISEHLRKFFLCYLNNETLAGIYKTVLVEMKSEFAKLGIKYIPKIVLIASGANQTCCVYARSKQ